MSYKLSFQSENARPSLAANQGQNAPMLFSVANPHSFAGSLFCHCVFSSVRGWRGKGLKVHENGRASGGTEAGLLIAAQRYTSCCTSAFGTKRNKKVQEGSRECFFFLALPQPSPSSHIKLKTLSYLTVKNMLMDSGLQIVQWTTNTFHLKTKTPDARYRPHRVVNWFLCMQLL